LVPQSYSFKYNSANLKSAHLQVLEQFRVIFKSLRRHYRAVEKVTGVSGAELWALAHVAGTPGGGVGALARALAVHQSTASNLLRGLAGRGLVARERKGADQRNVQLFATPKGLRVLRRAPRPRIGVLQQALLDLPVKRLVRIQAELKVLIAKMRGKDLRARRIPLSVMR
jgi:MarR family transcriptional regulator, organic hydroperoxide resistance regulator